MRFSQEINIGGIKIGPNYKPFVIAEMSGNHNHSIERALEIVKAAKDAGAHAIKLQTYTADTMTLDLKENEFFVSDKENIWKGQSLYELYEKAHTPWEWHKQIFDYAKELGLVCFSTPFDDTAVDFLEELNVPCYKIASFENTDIPLLKKIAKTGKPVIMSTGMATFKELAVSIDTLEQNGCKDLILLKCTSAYPSTEKDANMKTIPHMREAFGVNVGLSDHSMGIAVPIVATSLGAVVIEKHFTLSREDGGVDSSFSLTPAEFKQLMVETSNAFDALGKVTYERAEKEKKSAIYRRSIYVSKDIKKGEKISSENVKIIRPAFGLEPIYYDLVIGREARVDMPKGTALTWDKI
jgi:pseudaminic acid synthase